MPWPKGKPRKGHVNKDGTPHAQKGARLVLPSNPEGIASAREVLKRAGLAVGMEVLQLPVGVDPFKEVSRKERIPASVPKLYEETEEEVVEHWGHSGNHAVTEVCPKCKYVYADGGYCPECGWMRAIRLDPYDSNRGRKFK